MSEKGKQQGETAVAFKGGNAEFLRLLKGEFVPQPKAGGEPSPEASARFERVKQIVETLADEILKNKVIGKDVFEMVDALKAAIDEKLSKQINEILHNEAFQRVESTWRGLDYLIRNTSLGPDLKIKVLNISKAETQQMMRQYEGKAFDKSPLFRKVYDEEFGTLGGEPYGTIVCDYYFDHSPADVETMRELAKIGAAAHAPVIAGAGPSILRMSSWQDLYKPRDLASQFEAVEYAAWNGFRKSNDSRYMALTMPRFLGRDLYGSHGQRVEEFDFEEDTDKGDHDKHLWINSSYGLATCITNSFRNYGWCTSIAGVESGGTIDSLPTANFPTDDGTIDAKCPTEVSIPERRDAELSRAGLIALTHRKNTDEATFIGSQTVNKPAEYEDDTASKNAKLSAGLPYIFASCRFAHYLKCMIRDWLASKKEEAQIQRELVSWVNRYVDGAPDTSTDEVKARKPLRGASVEIIPDERNPGYYQGIFKFRPHYLLQGMDVSLSMVSRLPPMK